MLEISLKNDDSFNIVRETLTRIGVTDSTKTTLIQSAHILHKRGRYYIVHFKEMFSLDGGYAYLQREDIARRNTIALMLQKWGMIKIVNPDDIKEIAPHTCVTVVPFKDKQKWKLVSKYTIGNKKPHGEL